MYIKIDNVMEKGDVEIMHKLFAGKLNHVGENIDIRVSPASKCNIYELLGCFQKVNMFECHEGYFEEGRLIDTRINILGLHVRGQASRDQNNFAHTLPKMEGLRVLRIYSQAKPRWDQIDNSRFPDLEHLNYYHGSGLKQNSRIELPGFPLLKNV